MGFEFAGFLRTLQADFLGLIGFLFAVILVVVVLRRFIRGTDGEAATAAAIKTVARWAAGIAVALFLGHAVTRGFSNRIPRSDVDKSGVYEQMQSH